MRELLVYIVLSKINEVKKTKVICKGNRKKFMENFSQDKVS